MPDDVGGISASVVVTTDDLLPGMNRARAALDQLEARFQSAGAAAAASTTRIDAGMTQGGKGASRFANQLQVVGQTLDDLQYVGEMGLRPILNNLMQISPVVGTAVLAFDLLRRSGLDLGAMANSLAEEFNIDFGTALKVDEAEESFRNLTTTVNLLGTAWKNFVDYVKSTPGVWSDALGITKQKEEAAIKAFEEAPDEGMKERGKAVAEAIDEYGRKRFLGEMVNPAGTEEQIRKDKTELMDLIKRAKGGDRAAIFELEERTEGKGVGEAIRGNLPGVKGGRAAMEADSERRRKEAETKAEAEAREGETVEEQIFQDALTERSRAVRERDKRRKEGVRTEEGRERLTERGFDLNWRMMQLLQPTKQGGTLSLDAFEQATKGVGGLSEEAKQLHAIRELDEEIKTNTDNLKKLGPKKIAR